LSADQLIKVGNEELLLTGTPTAGTYYIDRGVNSTTAASMAVGDVIYIKDFKQTSDSITASMDLVTTSVFCADTSIYTAGDIIKIGDEEMDIDALDSPTEFTVNRGYNSTTISTHSVDASIYTPYPVHSSAPTIVTYVDENFDSLAEGANVPTGWWSGAGYRVYGFSVNSVYNWEVEAGTTPSTSTGPYQGHSGSDTVGTYGGTAAKYMYIESSARYNMRHLLRTPALDFTNSLSNSSLKLTFWFHMYGASTGSLGIAATSNSTNAGVLPQIATGTGFSSDTAGGLDIVYWDNYLGTTTSNGVRITGEQQRFGHTSNSALGQWRKAEVDLNALVGAGTVYLWFFGRTGTSYTSDIAIDSIKIVGEE